MYYLIDTSGSMNHNGCIQSVNQAMPEIVEILRDVSTANSDYGDIYLSCIAFSDHARVLDPAPVASSEYRWREQTAHGLTNLAEAYGVLDMQLREEAASGAGNLRPAIILLSDGDPDRGWEEAFAQLEANPLFACAHKVAIAIGASPANVAMQRALVRFAGSGKQGGVPNIISVTDLNRLTDVIRMVSSTVSRVGSRTGGSGMPGASDPVGEAMRRAIENGVNPLTGVKLPAIGPDSDFWN